MRAAIGRHVNQSIVGAGPDAVDVERRRRHRIDDAALGRLRRRFVAELADVGGNLERLPGEIRADLRPAAAAGRRLPQRVAGEIEHVRIDGGKEDRCGPQRADAAASARQRRDVLHLAGPAIGARRRTAAVNNLGAQRIGRRVPVLVDADRMPFAKRDGAVVAAARDARRTALLLTAAHPIRKRVVCRDVVHLRRRLVVPRAPRLAAVDADDRPLIARERDDVRIVRVDPAALIVVASRRAADAAPRLAAVDRSPRHDAGHEDGVGIFRVDERNRQIASADAARRTRIGRDSRPAVACVVRAIDADRLPRRDRRVDAARLARRDRDVGLHDVLRQTACQRTPGRAAVGRFEDAAVGAVPGAVLPRTLTRLPQTRVDDVGIPRIELEVRRAGVLVLVEHFLKRSSAVDRSEDAALFVRPVRMAQHRNEQAIGVARVDDDVRNLLAVAKAEVRPRLPRVGRFVDAVAGGEVGPRDAFAAADVDHIGIGRRNGDGADRSGRLVVENRLPRAAVVVRHPDAAVDEAGVEDIRVPRHAGDGFRPPASVRTDRSPAHRCLNRSLVARLGSDEHTGDQRRDGHEHDDDTASRGIQHCGLPIAQCYQQWQFCQNRVFDKLNRRST